MMGRLKTVSLRARRCWGQEVSRGLADRALSTLRQKTSQSICPGPLQEFHATLPLIGSMGLSQHGHLLGLTLGHKEGLQHTLHQGRGDVARLEAPKQRDLIVMVERAEGGLDWREPLEGIEGEDGVGTWQEIHRGPLEVSEPVASADPTSGLSAPLRLRGRRGRSDPIGRQSMEGSPGRPPWAQQQPPQV